MSKKSVAFEVWGKVPSKSNFRYSSRSKASRDAWKRIKGYEHTVGVSAMAAGARYGRAPKPISLTIFLHNQDIDLDNALKCPIDGLKGVVVPDDTPKWIPDIRVIYADAGGEPMVRYEITYLNGGDAE